MGKDWDYRLRRTELCELEATLAELAGPDLLGINLTLPLKEEGLRRACTATPEARQIGAANCLRWSAGGWEAHNSDARGWLDSWDSEVAQPMEGRKALVLGAGGACRAVLWALRSRNIGSLVLLARNPAKAEPLLGPGERRAAFSAPAFEAELEPGTIVVQTTPLGMWPGVEEVPLSWPDKVPSGCVACDLIYNPAPTVWLRQARQRGLTTLDGGGMLVHQALGAIEWWTGLRAGAQGLVDLFR